MVTQALSAAAAAEMRAEAARRQVTYTELAIASGLDKANVSRKLNAKRAFSLDEFALMAQALNLRPSTLLDRAEEAALAAQHETESEVA